jgi:translocator protein
MTKRMKFIIAIALPIIAGAIGSIATSRNVGGWYNQLIKPSWAPPSWLFGPVWTFLYLLIGVAFYLFWTTKTETHWKVKGISIFITQLVLNALWSFLFFEIKWMGVALVEIIILWIAIFLTILVFSRINKLSAWLMVPYIAWVSFASFLNYEYWYLNKLIEY